MLSAMARRSGLAPAVSALLLAVAVAGCAPQDEEEPSGGDARYFKETGQSIAGPIRRLWEEKGGLEIFGLPITAETREGGVVIQYFERARFELAPGGGVALGHLGRELYERTSKRTPAHAGGAAEKVAA